MQDTDDDKIPVTAPPVKDKARDKAQETDLNGREFSVESDDYCRPCGYPLTDDRNAYHTNRSKIQLCGDCWRATLERRLGISDREDGALKCYGHAGERSGHWIC